MISADVRFTYPDTFYMSAIYPSCFLGVAPVSYSTAFMPTAFLIGIPGIPYSKAIPIQFHGDSIQVARRVPGSQGIGQWPFGTSQYSAAAQEVSRCLGDTARAAPRRDKNWNWIAVDVSNKTWANFDFSKVAVDNNSDIHIVYHSKDDPENSSQSMSLFYSKVVGNATVKKEKVSDNVPISWFPWVDVDSAGKVHTVWQSGNGFYYNAVDSSLNVGTQKKVASLNDSGLAKPSLKIDSQNNPYILWKDSDINGNDILKYRESKNDNGLVNFDPEIILLKSINSPSGTKSLRFPLIDNNKKNNDIYVTWLERERKRSTVKYMKKCPYTVTPELNAEVHSPVNLHLYDSQGRHVGPDEFGNIKLQIPSSNYEIDKITGEKRITLLQAPDQYRLEIESYDYGEFGLSINVNKRNESYLIEYPETSISNKSIGKVNLTGNFDIKLDYNGDGNLIESITPTKIVTVEQDERNNTATAKLTFPADDSVSLDMIKSTDVQLDIKSSENGTGIPGWPISLTMSDGTEANTITDFNGMYQFMNLINGTYTVTEVMQNGWTNIAPMSIMVDINGSDAVNQNFTNSILSSLPQSTFNISGFKINGTNNNYTGIPGWPISLTMSDGTEAYTITDSNGMYQFMNLVNGTYTVTELMQDGWTNITPMYITVDINGADDVNENFTNTPSSSPPQAIFNISTFNISGFKINGTSNNDGGIPGWQISLTMADGTVANTETDSNAYTETDSNGMYQFTNLVNGTYAVAEEMQDGWTNITPMYITVDINGADAVNENFTNILLSSPPQATFNISGFKINGINSNDTGISGWQISLTMPDGTVAYTETDSNGIYQFTNLANGTYTVTEEMQDGWTNITPMYISVDINGADAANQNFTNALTPLPQQATFNISGFKINGTSNPLLNGIITVEKINDSSLDSTGFYTLGSFVRVNFNDNVLNISNQIELTINYPDYVLIQRGLSEKSISIYEKGTKTKINSTIDPISNRVTAVINGSGEYVVASTDLIPRIENITVVPQVTNIISANVKVSANITGSSNITNATVTLENSTEQMLFNPATALFESSITGPEDSGKYPVIITATDDNNNTATKQSYFILDLNPPEITIISPENISYVTNRINLSYYVDEESNQSYSVDGSANILVNNTKPFNPVTIPLTLPGGNHSITVSASDVFGHMGSKTVNFGIESQNIRVSDLAVPIFAKANKTIPVKATVTNTLIGNASNVEVALLVNDKVSATRSLNISGETSQDVEFPLVLTNGRFNITISSIPLPQEKVVDDNILTEEILITDRVPLLLVNDNPGMNDPAYSAYREAILAAGGPGYDFIPFDVSQKGPPGLELMEEFPLVIWFSGGGSTLTSIEQDTLKSYLNNRGYLLIFGNTLGRDIGETDFYSEYLFAEFRRQSQSQTIEGRFRDSIGNGFLFNILQPGEEIKPRSPATESFSYSGGESAAIKADNGSFKTAYFTFGLDDVQDQVTRNRIMDRVLNFFNIDITPPVIMNKKPEASSTFPMNTDNVTLSLRTDKVAECRLSDATNDFSAMKVFDSTNSLSHSTLVTNLRNGVNYTFYINCKDWSGNQNNTESFTFYIYNRTFLPPVVEPISDISGFENGTVTISINATDPNNDPLTIKLYDREIVGFVPIASRLTQVNQTFVLQATYDDAGRYYLRVAVSNGFSMVTRDFTLTVINVNRPPVLTPIGNQTVTAGTFFSMQVTAFDPDGEDLTFSANTTLFNINPFNGMITFTPKNSQAGDYYVNISVTDGELTDSNIVFFRVIKTNSAPVIEQIPPQRAKVGELFSLQINASDSDGDPLTFSTDTNMFNISDQGLINFTPISADIGSHLINITVTDGKSNDTNILNLVVTGVTQPPIITSITDRITIFINETFKINVTACHPDLDPECG